jgi:hypothetical protein
MRSSRVDLGVDLRVDLRVDLTIIMSGLVFLVTTLFVVQACNVLVIGDVWMYPAVEW